MKLNFTDKITKSYASFIFFSFEGKLKPKNEVLKENLEFIQKSADLNNFKGKEKQILKLYLEIKGNVSELIIAGLGKRSDFDSNLFRKTIFNAVKASGEKKEILICIDDKIFNEPSAVIEASVFSDYKFNKYKSKKKSNEKIIDIFTDFNEDGIKSFDQNKIIESIVLSKVCLNVRDMVNEPANVMYPEFLAKKAVEFSKQYGFEIEVFDEDYIKEKKMAAYLAVARASVHRPKLIVMKHMGNKDKPEEIYGLIGKGLTYDTGGLSIKPTSSMENMKVDMGGAATVIGAMSALSKLKVKKNVVAIIAACENSISGDSYRPGDIINSMAGKTIEVNNTDAEGRLTLVDAIHYAIEEYNVSKILDLATLTGSAIAALGKTTTTVITNHRRLYSQVEKAAKIADERVWQLPNFPEYDKLIESKIADMKNSGGSSAGAITAGKFIEKFVQEKPWIHFDIAGTVATDLPYDYYVYGATGQIVKTLFYFFQID